jgi:hypothetical protein
VHLWHTALFPFLGLSARVDCAQVLCRLVSLGDALSDSGGDRGRSDDKRHFENIITYLNIPITNAGAEGLNSKIQMIKYRARGYRNEGSFERAILFPLRRSRPLSHPLEVLKRQAC